MPLNNAATINKAKDGIILNWQNNLDASEVIQVENVNTELWTMGKAKDMRLIHKMVAE